MTHPFYVIVVCRIKFILEKSAVFPKSLPPNIHVLYTLYISNIISYKIMYVESQKNRNVTKRLKTNFLLFQRNFERCDILFCTFCTIKTKPTNLLWLVISRLNTLLLVHKIMAELFKQIIFRIQVSL